MAWGIVTKVNESRQTIVIRIETTNIPTVLINVYYFTHMVNVRIVITLSSFLLEYINEYRMQIVSSVSEMICVSIVPSLWDFL